MKPQYVNNRIKPTLQKLQAMLAGLQLINAWHMVESRYIVYCRYEYWYTWQVHSPEILYTVGTSTGTLGRYRAQRYCTLYIKGTSTLGKYRAQRYCIGTSTLLHLVGTEPRYIVQVRVLVHLVGTEPRDIVQVQVRWYTWQVQSPKIFYRYEYTCTLGRYRVQRYCILYIKCTSTLGRYRAQKR